MQHEVGTWEDKIVTGMTPMRQSENKNKKGENISATRTDLLIDCDCCATYNWSFSGETCKLVFSISNVTEVYSNVEAHSHSYLGIRPPGFECIGRRPS